MHFVTRFTKRPIEVEDIVIPSEAIVHFCLASANRDEKVFKNPMKFNPNRTDGSQSMTFGYGNHICPGSLLAREGIAATAEMMVEGSHSFTNLKEELPSLVGNQFRQPNHLDLLYRAA